MFGFFFIWIYSCMGLKICYLVVKKLPNPLFDIVFFINIPNLEFNYQKIIKNQKSNRKFWYKDQNTKRILYFRYFLSFFFSYTQCTFCKFLSEYPYFSTSNYLNPIRFLFNHIPEKMAKMETNKRRKYGYIERFHLSRPVLRVERK